MLKKKKKWIEWSSHYAVIPALIPLFLCVYVCCVLANAKDGSSVRPRSIKDTCVYLWGWGPCPPHRKAHSSRLFPAVWCRSCTRRPLEFLEEDGGRILAARGPSKASLKETSSVRRAHEQTPMLSSAKSHTCIKSMGVVIFERRSEAGQAVIRDFQNKAAVHDAVGRLEVPMAANVAVVKIVHSLVDRRAKNCFLIPFDSKKWQKWCALTSGCMLQERRSRLKDAKSKQNGCEIMFNSFRGGGGGGMGGGSKNVLQKQWVRHRSKLRRCLFLAEPHYLCTDIEDGAGRYRTRPRLDRRDTKPLLSGWIENNINGEFSAKFVIMSLSCFILFNSSVYFSIIHCTIPEIPFFFLLNSLCSFFFLSLTFADSLFHKASMWNHGNRGTFCMPI